MNTTESILLYLNNDYDAYKKVQKLKKEVVALEEKDGFTGAQKTAIFAYRLHQAFNVSFRRVGHILDVYMSSIALSGYNPIYDYEDLFLDILLESIPGPVTNPQHFLLSTSVLRPYAKQMAEKAVNESKTVKDVLFEFGLVRYGRFYKDVLANLAINWPEIAEYIWEED